MHRLQPGIRRALATAFTGGAAWCIGVAPAWATAHFDVPFAQYRLNSSPAAMTVADLNGDGTGAFSRGPATPFLQVNPSTASGHFDAGPTLDVVVGGERGAYVLLAQTDGTLVNSRRLGGTEYAVALGVGDVDGDGRDDVAVADPSGGLFVWMGPELARVAVLSQPPLPVQALVIADLNDDGFTDVGALRKTASRIDVYHGHGNGTFDAPLHIPAVTAPALLRATDLDADQVPELLVASLDTRAAGVHYGRDEYLVPGRVLPMGGRAAGLAVADWDADGTVDVTVADPGTGEILVRRSDGGGDFLPPQRLAAGGAPRMLRSADWNHDGRPDLLFVDTADATLGVLPSAPQQGLGSRTNLPVPGVDVFDVADLDGDGVLDLAGVRTAASPLQLVWIAQGAGDGGIRAQHAYELPGSPAGVTLADWNGDGHPDVLVACPDLGAVVWLPANGDGTFQPVRGLATRVEPVDVACGDFDQDGTTDLAVAHAGDRGLTMFRRGASGTLQPWLLLQTGDAAANLDTADLDADGLRDLVLTASYHSVQIVDGDRVAANPATQPVLSGYATAIAVADANGDGLPELWVANGEAGTVTMLANRSLRTPVFAAGARVTRHGPQVHLEWRFAAGLALPARAAVERAASESGPWAERGVVMVDGSTAHFVEAALAGDVWYRLRLVLGSTDQWTAPVLVPAAAYATALSPPREVAGALAIQFELAGATGARLAVFDVRGRRLRAWTLPESTPGAGQLVWDRRDAAGSHVGRGMVFVQLDAGGARRIRKAVLCQP